MIFFQINFVLQLIEIKIKYNSKDQKFYFIWKSENKIMQFLVQVENHLPIILNFYRIKQF